MEPVRHSPWRALAAGLQVLGLDGRPLPLQPACLSAMPRDLSSVPGFEGDQRQLSNLLGGTVLTTDAAHMWLTPFQVRTGASEASLHGLARAADPRRATITN